MNRRGFLSMLGATFTVLAGRGLPWPRSARAADRLERWRPSANPLTGAEWRYVAGRIADDARDIGFVVCMLDARADQSYELLVQRQDFRSGVFAGKSYGGALTYDASSGAYGFTSESGLVTATWRLDQADQRYVLSVASPELTLRDLVLAPQGNLIAEGGTGVVDVGQIDGLAIDSDYFADWAEVQVDGVARGVARIDMQGLRPAAARLVGRTQTAATTDYDHSWFALAGQLDGAPVWISAWRIEAAGGPLWTVTVARGSGEAWQVTSHTERTSSAAPLGVLAVALQPLEPEGPPAPIPASTGRSWRVTAGLERPGDLLDLVVSVPPGQFASSTRQVSPGGLARLEEGVGVQASGTVLGRPLGNVALVVAESSAEVFTTFLPLV